MSEKNKLNPEFVKKIKLLEKEERLESYTSLSSLIYEIEN